MEKLILQVYVRQTLEGMQLAFKWTPGAREAMEAIGVTDILGESLAAFGEQLKMQGLGLTKVGPAILYGPDGRPVA